MPAISHKITARLERAPTWVFAIFAMVMAFSTYFCMYAFRKPFAAATYAGYDAFGLGFKDAAVISQLMGYALSKFIGIKFNSEMPKAQRAFALIGLIVMAEIALVFFAFLPPHAKVIAIFFNGIPLGAVWGLVFSFLEGRRISEILGAALSSSYIVASGYVKSAGIYLVNDYGVSEFWMPALTGLIFFPAFLVAVYGLSILPEPSKVDVEQRSDRAAMYKDERRAFIKQFFFGLLLLVVVYFFLTAYRDFRDNFMAEILAEQGVTDASAFAAIEQPVGLAVMVTLSLLILVKSNRLGLLLTYVIMITGAALIGASTMLFDAGSIGVKTWMTLVGLGLYLGYVPFGCVLFDRMIAALGVVATAVFLIYVSDAFAYGGSVGVVIYKRVGQADLSVFEFFRYFSYITCVASVIGFVISGAYFMRRTRSD